MMRLSLFLFCCMISVLRSRGQDGQSVLVCDGSVVAVKSVSVLCDSPYAYYYGNGAHRKSLYCDYGDKVALTVSLDVLKDLDENSIVYMTLAMSIGDELLYHQASMDLCATIGEDCTKAGTYQFSQYFSFAYVSGGGYSKFVPLAEMGFSAYAEGGYDLGGLNIVCSEGEVGASNAINNWWSAANATYILNFRPDPGTFGNKYGILTGTILVVCIFALVLMRQSGDRRKGALLDVDPQMEDLYPRA
jgi:hypothetical protein